MRNGRQVFNRYPNIILGFIFLGFFGRLGVQSLNFATGQQDWDYTPIRPLFLPSQRPPPYLLSLSYPSYPILPLFFKTSSATRCVNLVSGSLTSPRDRDTVNNFTILIRVFITQVYGRRAKCS